ncbi:MAG TPA: hypothetical protein VG347_09270 [Verrucomicrobiae bacterium]|nr:hypothetical protein [Verrucomicrobiae bacterium]
MKHLENDQLLEAIATCAAFGPSGAESAIERAVVKIKANGLPVTNVDPPVLVVRQILEQYRSLIVPEHYKELTDLDIYVPSLPLCNAVANTRKRYIIVYEGLLQALRYRLEASLIINAVGKQRATSNDNLSISDDDFKTLAFRTILLPLHFYRNHNPLPTVFQTLEPSLQQDAFIGFAGILIFVLLHELGHIKLHGSMLAAEHGEIYLPALACSEQLNRFKTEELEADQFAFEAFVPEARGVALINAAFAFQFFADLEQSSGIFKSDHPMIVNRLTHLSQLPNAMNDDIIKLHFLKMLENHRFLTNIQITGKHSHEDQLPRGLISSMAETSLYRLIDDEPTCRAALEKLLSVYQNCISEAAAS